jgi:hypothetical protein
MPVMSSDNQNPPSSSLEGTRSWAVDTISSQDKPISDIFSSILQHEEAGIPVVVRGLNNDPKWSPTPRLDPLEDRGCERQPPGNSQHQ